MSDISALLELMTRLRDPKDGCPWDLQQDFKSLRKYSLEEVYELVYAIDQQDTDNLKEELGDLLFHISFYAQIAQEQGLFDFQQIVDDVVEKLVRRHPHVFPEGTLQSRRDSSLPALTHGQIDTLWQQVKAQEQALKQLQTKSSSNAAKSVASILSQLKPEGSALQQAQATQKKVAKVGFDWTDTQAVIANLEGEIQELKQALASGQAADIEDEMGDVLLSAVNVSRYLQLDAETCLTAANNKFKRRFKQLEQIAAQRQQQLQQLSEQQLDQLWQQAKAELAANSQN